MERCKTPISSSIGFPTQGGAVRPRRGSEGGAVGRGPSVKSFGLFLNRKGRIIHTPVFEVVLLRLLDLNDEAFSIRAGAVQVKDGFAVYFGGAQLFRTSIGQILNMVVLRQHLVEEIDQQVFVDLRPEQLLETVVGKGVNVFILKRHVVFLGSSQIYGLF